MDHAPLRVAVIGSGPAGFYAAGHLLKGDSCTDLAVEVDMYDRLPTPWGLVRAGVAPDHPNIKEVSRVYETTARHPRFRFFGHIELGSDITRDELVDRYHAIVYAVGAQTDRRMGIAGEDLDGSWPATAFVAWYNGHPDYCDLQFDLSGGRAVVVGNGNVAADVARMLSLTRDQLAATDVADHALEALAASRIEEVVVLGRRGPAQAAFTSPELLELGELSDADVFVAERDVALDPMSAGWLNGDEARATARKNVEILRGYAAREGTGKRRRIVLRFLVSPVAILGGTDVEGVRIVRNELIAGDGGRLSPRATHEIEDLPASLVLRSIGYKGTPLPGVPFDDRDGTIRNRGGRVEGRRGEYAVGWIKRGPSGVIGTNKRDAKETIDHLLGDLDAGLLLEPSDPSPQSVDKLLAERKPRHVTYAGWEAIDHVERAAGESLGRPRVKRTTYDELFSAARTTPSVPTR
jgi:ferredoxin/flavodoxin---NADP+ reductase